MAEFRRGLVWVRRDLRLYDHRALQEATQRCESVAVVFVFDTDILGQLPSSDRRVTFIYHSLQEVDSELQKFGGQLIVRYGQPVQEIVAVARRLGIDAVFINHDYEPQATHRDGSVRQQLSAHGVRLFSFKDQVVFEKREVLNGSGQPFKVFTPYKNAWFNKVKETDLKEERPDLTKVLPRAELKGVLDSWTLEKIGFVPQSLWLEPGTRHGRKRLQGFLKKIATYGENRDYPAVDGTSGLSVHLRFGTISIRECVREARKLKGHQTWLNELIWREFYYMILDQYPHVVGGAFRPEYDRIQWPGTEEHFQRWCHGETGFPIVDAAMRHFNRTGWMHNRLRMIVASFLVKDLLVDWRRGEAYFARGLLDFDLAANNGGWQWCASTGCDAQPYFRIFNPLSQSERFDSAGDFIRQEIPELAALSNDEIHEPYGTRAMTLFGGSLRLSYPEPIVDHAESRKLALQLFKAARGGGSG